MDFKKALDTIGEFGTVEQVRPPLVVASGLPGASLHEIVLFEGGAMGSIFSLEKDSVEILVFSKSQLVPGVKIARTDTFVSVPVGPEILGTTIDPLGNPFSQADKRDIKTRREIDTPVPGLSTRKRIATPFATGVSVVDLMVPLGKGQKELVMGDRKSGKTSFLLSIIKNQVNEGAIAIYASVAKRKTDIKRVQKFLRDEGIIEKTVIVATTSYDNASTIYLTPYSAMAIAEHFRDLGQSVVLILDDLTTHAYFYREIALVANRFPGRDAYPGDIFHAHARLLERSGNFHTEHGETSITVLPVAEVVQGDLAGYITTNLMSMTDGHIFFDGNVYFEGRRPAVNVPLSVTRVGRQAQVALLRSINREISSFLTLYEKLQNLSHFGAELSPTVQETLLTGDHIYKYFNQKTGLLMPVPVQVILFSLIWLGLIKDKIEDLDRVKECMVTSYDGQSKNLFDEAMKNETFNQLLAYVSKNKDSFLTLCQTTSN